MDNFNTLKRIEIFKDTMEWIVNDKDLRKAASRSQTFIFWPDDYPYEQSAISEGDLATIKVTKERTFEAAMRLRNENPDACIAVLNFANAFVPGGGVVEGCSAQEESLCRCSTLYSQLIKKTEFYKYHNKHCTDKASDALMYSEDIVICKTDTDFPERLPKEEWCAVDVITMAAPDLRGDYCSMPKAELYSCHVGRATHLFSIAQYIGVDILVLGAFGCGAFENNPQIVAKAWSDAFTFFNRAFKEVDFAIYGSEWNYSAFNSKFQPNL